MMHFSSTARAGGRAALVALLGLVGASSCVDPAASATVLDITVRFDDALALDRVRVTITVDNGDAFAPFVSPETPRPLVAAGEALEVLLPDDVGDHELTVFVEGLAGNEVLADGKGIVDAIPRGRAAVLVILATPTPDGDCGDGSVDATGGEECDDTNVAAGDGCAPDCTTEPGFSCSGAPSVCSETCGDGVLDAGEACDDEDLENGDGCSDTCGVEPGFTCTGAPSVCGETCGDGSVDDGETCDDGDRASGDGCSDACAIEAGFVCSGEPSLCSETCGDGVLDDGEGCDDAGLVDADGCSAGCAVEAGFVCSGEPSSCARTCDNGQIDPGEGCDDGGQIDGDGCSASCALESGFACEVPGQPCATVCGDALIRGLEACDDGDADAGDGCDGLCAKELGFLCTGEPSTCVPACSINGADVLAGVVDPANPCLACNPAADPIAYSAVDDGTACDDGLFCNGADTCNAGACTSAGSPCAPSQPLCLEAADLCSCAGSSCSNGSFCDGAEACGVDGQCQAGTPLQCAPEICSESASGCVECAGDGDCAAPNPSCFQERCTECPTCPCKFGEHDGGAGECVPVGDCSPGFDLGFVDGDGDGVGAGALRVDCAPFPFPAGISADGSDCNDGNVNVFRQLALFADNDLDGFTNGGSVVECIGAAVPSNRKLAASPPPNVSFEVGSVVQTDVAGPRSWDPLDALKRAGTGDTEVTLDAPQITETLTLTNLDLRVPAVATVRGVAVHVFRRTRASVSGSGLDRTIELVGGTGTSANRADLTTPWPVGAIFAEAVYGGPTDLWGMTFTPAQVNATGFGVRLNAQTTAAAEEAELEIDHVWIEVFTSVGDDCADNNVAVWSTRPSFVDVDVDGFGAGGLETSRCVGDALPVGVSQRSAGNDCFDTNASAHPGQNTFFSTNRGDGSFDYNCVNGQEKQTLSQATSCACDTAVGACTTTSTSFTPAQSCGATNASNDVCSIDPTTCVVGGGDVGCSVANRDTATVRCR